MSSRKVETKDRASKKALVEYIKRAKEQRLFQSITNFVKEHLDHDVISIYAGKDLKKGEYSDSLKYEDTFFWNCDEKFKD